MREMRAESQAEEQQIEQERAHSDARLTSMAVLKRPIRELPALPPAVALSHRATVRDALEVMRDRQLSCVLVVEQGQLVGVFTERDVVTQVAVTRLDIDQVRLGEVMRPDPDCLGMDDALVDVLYQMQFGDYRHVPVVDEQRRPTALVSMQTIVGYLMAAFPQEVLNLPPSPAHSHGRASTPEGA
jgi:CBS domain-containing protein